MSTKKDAPGMAGQRARNSNGQLRQKRSDTLIGTIEDQYNIDLNVRSDMELGNYLKENKIESLNDLVHRESK